MPSVNEQVAAACGFTYRENSPWCYTSLRYREWRSGNFDFCPATDSAAALKAWTAYADKWGEDVDITYMGKTGEDVYGGLVGARISDVPYVYADDFCTAICRAIIQAEETRNGS